MPTARVLIKQGSTVYRFMRFDTSADGSLLAFLDRDPCSHRGGYSTNEEGIFVPDEDVSGLPLPSCKFSIHTTGEIHRYAGGDRKSTIHIEPLYALTKVAVVGFISIPRPSRLDPFVESKHRHDAVAILNIPEDVSERISFAVELSPAPQQPITYGVALNYEIYSAIVRVMPTGNIAPELAEHFIHGMPRAGQFDKRQIDKANAELAFYQRIHGRTPIVFREDRGGAYVLLAVVPMRTAPKLKIGFDRDDLKIEIIPFEPLVEPTHKVRFWICDKGGRNKKDDLRQHIKSIELNAEL
jgi:hypothetical protein